MTVKKSDFKRMSWNEFGKRVNVLYKKTQKYLSRRKLKFDAIVPILREGGFLGLYLAFRFNTWKIIPIQFKYPLIKRKSNDEIEPEQKFEIPKLLYDLPKSPVFLLVDVLPSNPSPTSTSVKAAKLLKRAYPKCRIIYVSFFGESDSKKPKIFDDMIIGYYYGDSKSLLDNEKRFIDTTLWLLPWENLEEEYASINCKKYNYS